MTVLILLGIVLLVAIGWLKLRDRMNAIESRLQWSNKQASNALERQISELSVRVFTLEQQLAAAPKAQPKESVAPQAQPVILQHPARVPKAAPPLIRYEPAPIFSSPVVAAAPAKPSLANRLRQLAGDSEWETLLAGSVMNKIGALVLVIGIALFLGYSFKHVNPAGRAAAAALVSACILGGGIVLERRRQYQVFSRGLIGAGWAALYTTAYAMYALPAAQVISNPFAGSVLLLAVSAGMIAHSLRYRTQAVTAVAYFTAFAALAVTPSTPFAVASLIPLAASLLYFAWRFEWHSMAFFGLLATYATCISKGNSNAPLNATTTLFIAYWLLFEAFDVLRSRGGSQAAGLTWIFPMNAIAFLSLTYRVWFTHAPTGMWQIAALSALLFFSSAMLRIWFRPPSIATAATDPLDCIRKGTYQAPLTISAVLAGLAILGRTTGFWTNIGLAFEAEILYLAGVRFRSRFLRALGRSGFVASLSDVLATASRGSGTVSIAGVSLQNWTPSVIVHVFLFYLNRVVWRAATVFSFAATGLLALVIASELKPHAAAMTLFLFALLLFELALRKKLLDLRIQSYLVACTAALWELWAGGFAAHAPVSVWAFSGISAIACWLFTARMLLVPPDELRPQEIARVRDVFATSGSGFAMLSLWMLLPGPLTVVAWAALALAWIVIASLLNVNAFRWLAAGLLGMAYVRLLGVNLTAAWEYQNVAERWMIPLFVIGILYFAWHVFRRVPDQLQQSFAPVFTWFGVIPALWLLSLEVDRFYLVGAWAALALLFLIAGLRTGVGAFRWQSYTVSALSAISCLVINFAASGRVEMLPRILGASLLIALLFTAEFLLPRNAIALSAREPHARSYFSILATLLLTALLYHEVSGGLLTVAWGLEALACLGTGFPGRERILRLEGLAIFALCILKLFLYDLRNLETAYRILSFIALGVILLSISWIYTRFRVRIQRYL